MSERQTLVLNRLLDGFEGKLTTSKYAKLAKCSADTALRDIQALVERGVLTRGPEKARRPLPVGRWPAVVVTTSCTGQIVPINALTGIFLLRHIPARD